jgi:hypothetical protein
MERLLEMARTQVPVELALDQLDADEEFDVEQVVFIRSTLLPLMAHVESGLIRRLLAAIEANSHLYTNPMEADDERLTLPTGLVEVRPVIKERFAITCLHALFLICADQTSADSRPDPGWHARSAGHLGVDMPGVTLPEAIRRACLPVLLQRCQNVLIRYVADKELLGRMPFPRVRQDEMLYVLQELNSLCLPTGLSEEHGVASEGFTNSAGPMNSSHSMRKRLLASKYGHLFYLYPQYCECLRLDDQPVLVLVQRAFALMGLELGLVY